MCVCLYVRTCVCQRRSGEGIELHDLFKNNNNKKQNAHLKVSVPCFTYHFFFTAFHWSGTDSSLCNINRELKCNFNTTAKLKTK